MKIQIFLRIEHASVILQLNVLNKIDLFCVIMCKSMSRVLRSRLVPMAMDYGTAKVRSFWFHTPHLVAATLWHNPFAMSAFEMLSSVCSFSFTAPTLSEVLSKRTPYGG